MLFYLVHELDNSLLAITDLEKLARSRQTREEQIKKDETVEIRTGSFDTFEEAYYYSIIAIWVYLCITAFYAVFAKLVDLLLGPLQWKHITALYVMITVSVAATRKRPVELIMMIATLSIMPGVISGSVTRLIGALFSLGAILWPFVLHTWENISDRTEVRWVLIGLLLDLVYLGTARLISQVDKLGLKSIGLVLVVLAAECAIFCLGVHIIFIDGPWTRFVAIISPVSNFLQSFTRYSAQLLLFYLNRCARYILAATFTPRLPRIGTSEFLANLRNELYSTSLPNNTSYGPGISSYAYQGLQGRDTIRLLLIRKGSPSQELECNFKVVQLGSPEAYEAVSYVWGHPSATHSILVDGRRLAITKSAYDIIHRRRSALIDQCIWIDRICINQGDMVEKASQVLMMGDIYKGAARVIAYLGDSENAHLVQLLFAELHFMKHGIGLPAAVMKSLSFIWFQRPKWDALIEFFGNKWFRRVWIVQEAAFAHNLILFYGNICLDWEYVSRTADILLERTMIDTVQPNHGDPGGSGEAALVGVRNVDTMLEFHGDINYRRKHDLALVLNECITFDSTDPRDKVFALLGLTTDNSRDHIKPNYSKEYTTQQVYTDAMRFILANSDNPINILEWAGIGTQRSIPDLPSWVPDWSLTTPSPMEANRYNCGTQHRPKINLDMDTHLRITLNGIQFDRIKKLGPNHKGRSSYGRARNWTFLAKWVVEAEALATAQITETYNNGESRLEAFIRTIVGNDLKDESGERPRKEQFFDEYEAFKSFLDLMSSQELGAQIPNTLPERFLKQPFSILQAINRFSHYFQTATDYRAFCVTEDGRMAIVPPLCLPGDILCIIKGARTPFVLRNKESTSYSLIGCCYVHGVMEGEIDIQESHPFVLV